LPGIAQDDSNIVDGNYENINNCALIDQTDFIMLSCDYNLITGFFYEADARFYLS
jgi:hypothetical protein